MQHIARFNDTTGSSVVFTDSQSTTGGFTSAMHAGAILFVTATSTSGSVVLTFGARPHASSSSYFVAASDTNSPVAITVQPNRCYAVPDALFASPYVTATTASGTTVTCNVFLKG